jgi:hypothetical protein
MTLENEGGRRRERERDRARERERERSKRNGGKRSLTRKGGDEEEERETFA